VGKRETGLQRVSERELVIALVRLLAQPAPERMAAVRQLVPAVDMTQLLALLAAQNLVPTLGRLLLRDELSGELDDDVAQAIELSRTRARQRGLLNHGVTTRLARALDDAGIKAAPLKGAVLADTVYGDIGARQSSDIDVLVPVADLDRAVEVAEGQGWHEPELLKAVGVPRLHRELFHQTLPPLELHWRVHWYEESFAPSALDRAERTADGWLRLQPTDELVSLLLFLARDGFAGLRQTLDVVAWWAALGTDETAGAVRAAIEAHPSLERALTAAAWHAEELAGIPHGALGGEVRLSRRQLAALRLANPWLVGSRPQIRADVSLVDGLLAPPDGGRAFIGRQLLLPRSILVRRQPDLQGASAMRVGAARLSHAGRVLLRYVLGASAALAKPRATWPSAQRTYRTRVGPQR
jgi:hypothetical protein